MLEIIKYQLKERKGPMLLILALFGIMNALAIGLEIWTRASGDRIVNPELMFWVAIACTATAIITLVMFFMCASGHVNHLLYRDTSYLMLTVPRHGWEILGGRFIAGIVEFAAYLAAAGFLASIHIAILAPLGAADRISSLAVFAFMYEQTFFANFVCLAQAAFIGLCFFAVSGMIMTFAVVVSRSFVKNKGAATAVAIAIFFLFMNWGGRLSMALSAKLNWYWTLKVGDKPIRSLFLGPAYNPAFNPHFGFDGLQGGIPVPVAPIILAIAVAAALFAEASWLMEKRVEL